MQYQRNIHLLANGGEAGKVQTGFFLVEAVGGADGHRQRVDTGATDKLGRLERVGKFGMGGIDDEVILLTAQLAQLRFDAGTHAVAEGDHAAHFLDVLFKRKVRGIDHGRANARFDLVVDVLLVFVVIQMQHQWDAIFMGGSLTDGDQILDPGMAIGTRGASQNNRRAHASGGAGYHLHGFQVVDVESRYRITAALGIFEHFMGRDQIHSDS